SGAREILTLNQRVQSSSLCGVTSWEKSEKDRLTPDDPDLSASACGLRGDDLFQCNYFIALFKFKKGSNHSFRQATSRYGPVSFEQANCIDSFKHSHSHSFSRTSRIGPFNKTGPKDNQLRKIQTPEVLLQGSLHFIIKKRRVRICAQGRYQDKARYPVFPGYGGKLQLIIMINTPLGVFAAGIFQGGAQAGECHVSPNGIEIRCNIFKINNDFSEFWMLLKVRPAHQGHYGIKFRVFQKLCDQLLSGRACSPDNNCF